MGNVECCMGEEGGSATIERLENAVRRMDVKDVQFCIESGVNINAPVNRQGHTILDIFATEHQNLLKSCSSSRGRSQDATRMFCEAQAAAADVLGLLRRSGAVLSGQSATLRRGL